MKDISVPSAVYRYEYSSVSGDGLNRQTIADFQGCRPPCTSGSAMNSQWCQMFFEQSTPFNLSLSLSLCLSVSLSLSPLSPPPSPHLFVHFFYLFKAEIYGLYQAWKGKTNVTVDKKKINHRLLFYSSIFVYSRDLFSLSFFGRNKKSFSIPKPFVCFSFLSSLKLKHKGVERKSIKLWNIL